MRLKQKTTKNLILKSLLSIAVISLLTACSSKEQINPAPLDIKEDSIKDQVQKDMFVKQGYSQGKVDGYKDGLAWSEQTIKNLLREIHAIQFASYLYKENYIQPGPIYIEDGKITLSKMEIQPPYTKADIFQKFGAEIPKYISAAEPKTVNPYPSQTPTQPNAYQELPETSFTPNIFVKDNQSKIITNDSRKNTYVYIDANKSNKDILIKFGYKIGTIDNEYVLKFETQKEAIDFCGTVNICKKIERK